MGPTYSTFVGVSVVAVSEGLEHLETNDQESLRPTFNLTRILKAYCLGDVLLDFAIIWIHIAYSARNVKLYCYKLTTAPRYSP